MRVCFRMKKDRRTKTVNGFVSCRFEVYTSSYRCLANTRVLTIILICHKGCY